MPASLAMHDRFRGFGVGLRRADYLFCFGSVNYLSGVLLDRRFKIDLCLDTLICVFSFGPV